jgi:hypothetical protein
MNECLRSAYVDPRRGCGFEWSVEPTVCAEILSNAPARLRALVAGQEGQKGCGSLQWNAAAYFVHVADVLRIWSDRLAAAALGNSDLIVRYHEGRLGDVRGYPSLPLAGALWSLERAAGDWQVAEELAHSAGVTLDHPEQGPLSVNDVRRIMAHEVEHHAADLSLIVSG